MRTARSPLRQLRRAPDVALAPEEQLAQQLTAALPEARFLARLDRDHHAPSRTFTVDVLGDDGDDA
jgi:hypothetical protein